MRLRTLAKTKPLVVVLFLTASIGLAAFFGVGLRAISGRPAFTLIFTVTTVGHTSGQQLENAKYFAMRSDGVVSQGVTSVGSAQRLILNLPEQVPKPAFPTN